MRCEAAFVGHNFLPVIVPCPVLIFRLDIVKENITELKQKIKPKQAKPVLSDPDVKKHLKELHRKFVVVTIDKA